MSRIRIAVDLLPQHADYAALRDAALRADRGGADILYTWDHFFPLFGDPGGRHFECFTTLASLAEVTEHAEIGPLVACNSYRNPHLLADMARTLDHISGGRFILGLGAGWFERDYREYGYSFGTAGSRLRALGRALPVIRERLEKLNPPPLRRMPILIGGGGEKKTLRLTARHADIWHGFGDLATLRHKLEVLCRWCALEGRDPAEIECSTTVDPKRLDLAERLLEIGIRQFVLECGAPDFDLSWLPEWTAWREEKHRVGL